MLGHTERRKENDIDSKAVSLCESVCSVMKDIREEALFISQKNHKLSEDWQRNHSELLKTYGESFKRRQQLFLGGNYNMEYVQKCIL